MGRAQCRGDAPMERFDFDATAWAELSPLLDAVLELPPRQRGPWIEALSPEYEALKPRLRDLLSRAALIETSDFLQSLPTLKAVPEVMADGTAAAGRAGDTIGPYRLIRELGSGGMGRVWLAERTDGLINRPVALKFPHGSWHRAGLAERMAREREILATLNHPNIARLYDAGVTPGGQPYLALEFVEGRPIDEHCKLQQLGLRARLGLFLQVAKAIAYAHSKLIVHRDLKPSNILVSDDHQVRLLDFGVAKLLEQGQARESQLTELSGRALTPDYASPEHIAGAPITIGSDVYSLGVVLYELLTDARPYRLKRDSRGALEDAILQSEATRPSEVAAAPVPCKALRGDVDTIVLKALKKNLNERYATVNELADDIARYLQGRPVLAQPDSLAYRMRRFVGRNKLAVGAASSVLLAVIVGSGVALWQARVAIAERERAEQVKEFIASIMRDVDPYARNDGQPVDATDLLHAARDRVGRELAEQPQARIELLGIIAESFEGLKVYATAAEVLEQALHEADAAPDIDQHLVLRLRRGLSEAYTAVGRIDDAKRELKIVLDARARGDVRPDAELINVRLHQATLAMEEGKYGEVLKAAEEALQLAETSAVPNVDAVIQAVRYSALAHRQEGRVELAVTGYRRAYELALDLYAQDVRHPVVMETRMGYARALRLDDRSQEALPHMQAATAASIELFGVDSSRVGNFLTSLGDVQTNLGDLRVGIENCRKGLAIYERSKQPGTLDHAIRMRVLARALLTARQSQEAAQHLADAITIATTRADHRELTLSRVAYAQALMQLGRFDEADAALGAVIAERDQLPSPPMIDALGYLGALRRLQGDAPGALVHLEKSLELARERPRAQLEQGWILNEVGGLRADLGQNQLALEAHSTALELLKQAQTHLNPAQTDSLVGLGRAYLGLGRSAAALTPLEQADAFWREFDPENRWAGEAALWLGHAYLASGRSAEAKPALARAEKILSRSPLPGDRKLIQLARKG